MKTITLLFSQATLPEERETTLQRIRNLENVKAAQLVFPDETDFALARVATVNLDNAFANGEVLEKIRAYKNVETAYISAERRPI